QEAASLVDDRIEFHGVKVAVSVHNAYRSRLFRERRDITIAADRVVQIHEDGIEGWFDTHLVEIKVRKRSLSEPPPYHAFAFELSKRVLKGFPRLIAFDRKGKFVGVTIFKPAQTARPPRPARTGSGKKQTSRRQG